MNFKKQSSLIITFLLFGFLVKAQSVEIGQVKAILHIGDLDISIIQNNTTGTLYKTTLYPKGMLDDNQAVELMKLTTPDLVEVVDISNDITIHAKVINAPTTNVNEELAYLLPEEENGILWFLSQEHLFTTYLLMDDYLLDGGENRLSSDEKLNLIESEYAGFTSYRTFFEQKFNLLEGSFTDVEIERIENLEFVNYEVLMTFLNKYRMIGIGDKVYYYHESDVIVEFNKDNLEILNLFESIAILIGEQDISIIGNDSPLLNLIAAGEASVLSNKTRVFSKGSIYDQITGYGYQTVGVVNNDIDACLPMRKSLKLTVSFYETGQYSNYQSYSLVGNGATLVVNWGDGVTISYPNYDGTYAVIHDYLIEGTYEASSQLTFTDFWGSTQVIYDGVNAPNGAGIPLTYVASAVCTTADGQKTGQGVSGNWMLSAKLWVTHNFLGTHVGSYTHSWKRGNTPGTWNRKSSKINTSVDGTFRNDDCDIVENKVGSKTHNNDRKIEINKTKVFQKHKRIFQYDVHSGHSLEKDGTNISVNLSLIDC
jgi:hypothetical protein